MPTDRFATLAAQIGALPRIRRFGRIAEVGRGTIRLAGGGPLLLHPSLQVLRLDHPAVSIWQANQPGQDGACRAAGAEIALIWRRPDHQVPVARIAPGEAALLDALLRGAPLSAALADEAGDPAALLALLIRDALICDAPTPDGDPA